MKKLLLATVLTLSIPFTAQASSTPDFELCEAYSSLAETIMTSRQNGTDMSALIKIVLNQSEGTDQAALLLVKAAYKEHRYSTESIKQRTIQDFKNQVFLACYK